MAKRGILIKEDMIVQRFDGKVAAVTGAASGALSE
tara:strand:+ start:725 stop:829 length:105 start_codon:yes stop_codon:yes gene_type:complete